MYALPNPVAAAARARPDHPAVVGDDDTLTWRELADRASALAGRLAAAGLRPGDRVALRGPVDPGFVVALHAIGWAGAVAAPLSLRAPDDEVARALESLAPAARLGELPGALRLPDAPPLPERLWPLDEPRLVVLTSGSTGRPRPVVLETGQLVFSAFGSATRLGLTVDDRWLCCLPLDHVGGLSILTRTAWSATTLVLHPRFDPGRVARALDSGRVHLVSLVPEMLGRLLDARPGRVPFPPALRAVLLGGAPCPPELLARCAAQRVPVALTWGMSETASQVATRYPGDTSAGPHAGPPLPFAVVDAPEGRLRVRGPLAPGGELLTGDRGHVDTQGRIHPEGRADAVLISGGENVDPAEIEAALRAHPDVAEVAVFGRTDPRWGQRPVAWLVSATGVRPDDDALRAWCRERLAGHKVPDAFRWSAALPRTALGKVSLAALRQLEASAPDGPEE